METPNHMQWVPADGSLCDLPPHSSLCESRSVARGLETEDCLLAVIAEDSGHPSVATSGRGDWRIGPGSRWGLKLLTPPHLCCQ